MPRFFTKDPKEQQPTENRPKVSEDIDHLVPKITEAGEIHTLLTWEGSSRPYRKKDRSYYTTIAIIVFLLVLIAFLAREFLLIGVILSLTFVTYVLAFIPPQNIYYKLSTQGITIGDHFYFWHELESFWFKEQEGHKVLFIQTRLRFPAQIMLVLADRDEENIKKLVGRFLPFHEIPRKTLMDKWSEGLQKHFPLENTHK